MSKFDGEEYLRLVGVAFDTIGEMFTNLGNFLLEFIISFIVILFTWPFYLFGKLLDTSKNSDDELNEECER